MSRPEVVKKSKLDRPGLPGAVAIVCWFAVVSSEAQAQGWPNYAHDQQHTCQAVAGSQIPQMIRWSTPVDEMPQYTDGTLYIHYGSPIITRANTVLLPVKTTTTGGFVIKAINATSGAIVWTSPDNTYSFPGYNWVPLFGISLTPKDQYLVYPGPGGTVYARTFPDSAAGVTSQLAFYNTTANNYYALDEVAFDNAIQICTPISSDAAGNLFFGYVSSGAALPGYPNGIPSGLARISSTGIGSFVGASAMTGDGSIQKIAYNCSPCFSADGTTLYVAANNSSGKGYLCAINTTTLITKGSVLLLDPTSTAGSQRFASVNDNSSATPSVGPDGDVYYGVLSYNISSNDYRGYLLHFDSTLNTTKLPSAFGWDDTASIVPASAVPSYAGPSTYLLLTKYNNYADGGGTGINQVAIVDPKVSAVDPTSGITAMKVVIAVNGVTADTNFPNLPNAVREWCINSAAIDVVNQCAVVNSEDGHVYRWSFLTNSLSAGLNLQPPRSEAYTPTLIGPDGAVYAINNAQLFCCISSPPQVILGPPGKTSPPKPTPSPVPIFTPKR